MKQSCLNKTQTQTQTQIMLVSLITKDEALVRGIFEDFTSLKRRF